MSTSEKKGATGGGRRPRQQGRGAQKSRGGKGPQSVRGRRNGANRGRGGDRRKEPGEGKLIDDMIEYWAKSEDPKLRERAEKEKQERLALLNKQRQEKLDEEMKSYWKKQKVDDSEAPAPAEKAPESS